MHHLLSLLEGALKYQLDWVCFYIFLFLACVAPRLGDGLFVPIERIGSRFAQKKGIAVVSISFTAILIRLAFLGIDPVPVPLIHDEFSYLLAGDTFAHGRLTNPTHPMWIFFETFHVLQHPTYASKYPPAQGAVLALGQLLGNPWIGVLLSVGIMCGAILWMLQGWLPARWALLGGVLVLLRFAAFNAWVEGYWGGAVAAIGGALVVGALPRIWRAARPRYALCMGIGAAILANSRPVEGFILFATVAAALAIWLWRQPPLRRAKLFARIVMPIAAVLFVCVVWMGYYNWRVTKNPLLPPYLAYERVYNPRAEFIWQSPQPSPGYDNPQFDNYYNVWAPKMFGGDWDDIVFGTGDKLAEFFNFFVGKELGVCLLGIFWLWRDRRVRFLGGQFVVCLAGLLAVVWFWPHYAAPLLATTFALLVQCLRHVRRVHIRGWAVGVGLSRAVVLMSLASLVGPSFSADSVPYEVNEKSIRRDVVESQLASTPGQDLVIVRYSPDHDPTNEWVYNRADIDAAKIVWAREIPGVDIRPLLDYFRGRTVWLAQPDTAPTQLIPYSPPTSSAIPVAAASTR
ncbi:MAG: hypothetical protein WA871_01225 [Candidatus Acidiferrales bacterium]